MTEAACVARLVAQRHLNGAGAAAVGDAVEAKDDVPAAGRNWAGQVARRRGAVGDDNAPSGRAAPPTEAVAGQKRRAARVEQPEVYDLVFSLVKGVVNFEAARTRRHVER